MALKCREELVGKRFLSVRSLTKLKVSKIGDWEWRSGVIRAVSPTCRDTTSTELTVLVEFDDRDWQKREWIKVHEVFQVFLVEHTLVWAERQDPGKPRNQVTWPALCYKSYVDKVGLTSGRKKPVEYLLDRSVGFVEEKEYSFYQEGEETKKELALQYGDGDVQKAVKSWVDYQDGQRILLTTPTVLVGYRVEVYRAEGTTQWYTAVIQSYNHTTKTLAVTDDTVLEEHNEDPAYTQMHLIDDGVVDSILRGVEIGITPRRRPRHTHNNNKEHQQAHFTRRQPPSNPATPTNTPVIRPVISGGRNSKTRQRHTSGSSTPGEQEKVLEKAPVKTKQPVSKERKRKSEDQAEEIKRSASPGKRQKNTNEADKPESPVPECTESIKDKVKVPSEEDCVKESRVLKLKPRRSKDSVGITCVTKSTNSIPKDNNQHKNSTKTDLPVKVKDVVSKPKNSENRKLKSEKIRLAAVSDSSESNEVRKETVSDNPVVKAGENESKSTDTVKINHLLSSDGKPRQQEAVVDDNMHFKKQLLISSGQNHQPSLANIDLQRPLTDQVTKLAKAENISLNGDGKSSSEINRNSEAATSMAEISSEKSDKMETKPQALSPDRSRDSFTSSVQSHFNAIAPRSNTTTPATEDRSDSRERSDSRASDERYYSGYHEEKRPSSRLDDLRSLKNSPASSPLIVLGNEPVHPYRDPELMRKNPVQSNVLAHPKTMTQPTYQSVHNPVPAPIPGIPVSSSSLSSHPISHTLLTSLPYHHQLSSLNPISHPLPLPHSYPRELDAFTARGIVAQQQQQQLAAMHQLQNAHLMQLPYSHRRVSQLELLWQQKFPSVPIPPPWALAKHQEELIGEATREMERERMERERVELERIERERIERVERDRRDRERKEQRDRLEKAEREKAERERQEREKQHELERLEKERQDRLERERREHSRLLREQEQRQERERILHESSDALAAVDKHFTESLRLASQRAPGSAWPLPSITRGTGIPKPEPQTRSGLHPLHLVADKSHDTRKEEDIVTKRESERERERHHHQEMAARQQMDEKRYIQSQHDAYKQMIADAHQKSENKDSKVDTSRSPNDGKNMYGYPYPYPGGSFPPDKHRTIFNLYGYPSQPHPSIITPEQLQQHGLAPTGKHIKDEKQDPKTFPAPAHSGHALSQSPRSKEIQMAHQHPKEKHSSVIVENKSSVKSESPHYGSPAPMSSSPRPQPRPAHTPEHRPDRPVSSSASPAGIPHMFPHAVSTTGGSMFHQTHPTAFRPPESSRSQSPYKSTSQQSHQQQQQQQQQHHQSSPLSQPVDYCKSSSSSAKLKSAGASPAHIPSPSNNHPAPSSTTAGHHPGQSTAAYPAIAQPPVSLPPSTLSFTYSLIQQGLVPNPIYSHGPSQSAAKPATVQITRTPTPSAIVHTQSSVPSPMMSVSPPSSQSNPPTGQKRKGNRDTSGRKRTKGLESSLSPNSSSPMVTVPVTTPQILTNPSPYTTTTTTTTPKSGIPSVTTPATTGSTTSSSSSSSAAAVNALLSNPFPKNSGFMDSFRSFVESTVTSVFQQEEKKNPVGDNNRTMNSHKTAAESEKVSVPAEVKVEKMEVTTTPPPAAPPSLPPPPSTVNEDTSSSVVTTCSNVSSNIASSYMDTINRVANGQMDTDSDTLSAPSPPPQSKSDASPLNKSGSHPKNLKKAWLQRHSDEDKEMKSVPVVGEGNPSKDVKNNVLKESMDSSNSESCAGSPSAGLPNGNITDLGKQDDESTSSASETETVCTESTQPKKRVKTKKTNIGAKKLKTEEPANNSRKKTANKRKERETKESKTKEIKKEEEVVTKKAEEKPKIPSTKPSRERDSVSPPPPSNTKQQQQQQQKQQQQQQQQQQKQEENPSQQPKQTESTEQPVKEKKKNRRSKEPSKDSQDGKNGSSFNKPLVKHSVATLKRTCQPFVQDASCAEITPKLMKCRECKMTPTQRSKKLPNIFCRFYAFRRLRYSSKGVVTISGFSELSDAEMDDIEPWLSRTPVQEPSLDIETSKFIITRVGDKFCELVEQERETKALAGTNAKIAWKRAVTGVREMCDVCDTTLFNMHWVCHKCGFVVCLDCYKVKVRGTKDDGKKALEDHRWLTCSANRQPHDAEKLMLTQIIPSDALWELGKLIHEIRAKWSIPAKCPCGQVTDAKISGKNGLNQQILNNLSSKKALVNGLGEEPHHGKKSKKQSHHSSNEVSVNGKGTYNPDIASSPLSLLADVASMDSEGSRDRSDSPFSKRKSDQQEKKAVSEPAVESNDPNDKKMPASCSTLRELLTKTAGKVKVQNDGNKTKSKAKSSGNTLDDIIQSVVEKSCRDIDNTQPFKFMHYTPRLGGWTRDLPIMVHNLTETSVLYPDVPHSWLCDGRLLRLHDPRHKGNFKIFQEQWKRGQPVLVSGVSKNLDSTLWHPKSFGNDFGHQENDLVNCRTGNVIIGHQMGEFWDGFEKISCRPQDENDDPMLLKLKDWPPGDDFSELLPRHYQDLMQGLPLPEYTDRQGKLNLASRLPDFLVRPDLGPKMYNAYGSASFPSEGTTNLHLDISDAVNVMVYVGIPSGAEGGKEVHEAAAVKAIDDAGCDSITKRRVREVNEVPGALWQIYDAHDADKIRDFLNKVAKERGETIEPDHDPIHDQSWYLDEELRERVYKEYGVQGYTIVQCMGDAIFIPAGAPHQVRNLHSCIKVAEDFVSPEHLNHCFRLTQEFRQLSDTHSNHEDKLQVKNIIYHAVKDAIAVLRDTDPDEDD
ncbi:probable JmjC domain-containing histone demethylation protein 2C isoform X2 [Haliotis asinina]|uniref:probable JmjC domain-containing histone demethylation protein 2C isoform X2 n=1 Tax=Haliotis asinina TaxID=109174 RepID=UPI003531AFBB